MNYSNGLTLAETERIAILAEECAEVIQVVGKILRHGYESTHPRRPEQGTNRQHLEEEIGNIRCIYQMMVDRGDIDATRCGAAFREKKETIGKYLHHQEGL